MSWSEARSARHLVRGWARAAGVAFVLAFAAAALAGCGADAAPYFRVFNPYSQAAKFDPDARYLKRWLPELSTLPPKLLHEPWRDPRALAACGYPAPMVDLAATREAALDVWRELPAR